MPGDTTKMTQRRKTENKDLEKNKIVCNYYDETNTVTKDEEQNNFAVIKNDEKTNIIYVSQAERMAVKLKTKLNLL